MSDVSFFVGIDLGNTKHAVCIVDGGGSVVRQIPSVENDRRVLEFIHSVIGDTPRDRVHIGLEDRHNVVVDALLAEGFRVSTANPKRIDRFRDRETVSGAKSDGRDARVIARALITDGYAFQPARLDTEATAACRSFTAALAELDDEHRRLSNQLRAVVLRFFPALLSLCEGADHRWFWSLLRLLRDAEHAQRVRKGTIEKLLKAERKRSVSADDVVALIEAAHLPAARAVIDANRHHVKSLIARLVVVERERTSTRKARDELLTKLSKADDDGKPSQVGILLSMPGVGPHTASLLVEHVEQLAAGGLEQLRAVTGVAPVTKQSGKGRGVSMRRACDDDLRNAVFHMANAGRREARFAAVYDGAIERKHNHARALRSVADVQLRVLSGMLKSRTTYAPAAVQQTA